MSKENGIAIVFDCGATNIRVVAMDTKGEILASHSLPNSTDKDSAYDGGRIWDLNKIWDKFCKASKEVVSKIDSSLIKGVTVTTFGVDGAFVDEKGELLYPVISWQCPRLQSVMQRIDSYMPVEKLYNISGVYPFAFNTISKMLWFKEFRPDVIDQSERFLFMPSLLLTKMGAEQVNDTTMIGTSMMADIEKRSFSNKILDSLGLSETLFGSMGEPGDHVGNVDKRGSVATGIPEGVPLFLAGHDTQFAIYGSGADLNQPVLSSGTWEILMVRSKDYSSTTNELERGITTEVDSEKGIFNIGHNWLGSGVLEWFSRNFYPKLEGDELYETMIKEAEVVSPGSHNLTVNPDFLIDGSSSGGVISGLTMHSSRGEIYRALLESLVFSLRESIEIVQKAGKFNIDKIICVGGGSKNMLWNQIRADVCNVPVKLIKQKETTVLGAALFVFYGAGLFASTQLARDNINFEETIIEPAKDNFDIYNTLFNNYKKLKKGVISK
ncbi:L-fuculokinase [Marinilabiliaceae bacterium ANBcel2]|nr:L-fuculokinase [Marinilabiliaceae bacterium ANBcel2]